MNTDTNKLLCAILIVLLQAGCSAQQMFATGQAYQRDQCLRILDKLQRDYCVDQISTDYEEYKREAAAIDQ